MLHIFGERRRVGDEADRTLIPFGTDERHQEFGLLRDYDEGRLVLGIPKSSFHRPLLTLTAGLCFVEGWTLFGEGRIHKIAGVVADVSVGDQKAPFVIICGPCFR